jgi:copper oxidase (laccase) domain-containing protein
VAPTTARAVGQLAEGLGLKEIAWCDQVHGDVVKVVTRGGLAGEADGLVTNTRGLGLLGRSADCPLVLAVGPVIDPGNDVAVSAAGGRRRYTGRRRNRSWVVGMAHASWRSTVGGITGRLVATMVDRFGVKPTDIIAGICPSAGPCCYEVGPEVAAAATAALGPTASEFLPRRDGRLFFDLWQANVDQLRRAGLSDDHIHQAGVCSICRCDLFPSYRIEGGAAGRFAAVIAGQ